jgi:hypothetical protein
MNRGTLGGAPRGENLHKSTFAIDFNSNLQQSVLVVKAEDS